MVCLLEVPFPNCDGKSPVAIIIKCRSTKVCTNIILTVRVFLFTAFTFYNELFFNSVFVILFLLYALSTQLMLSV